MISMSKFEMVKYLRDYANLQYLVIHNPKKEFGELFDYYMKSNARFEDDNREYYDRMRRVYMIYITMKWFSYIEDYLLNRDNYLNNDELDDIIPINLYSTNIEGISNKKILQLIRNGFNHNNSSDIDRFKISPNGKYVEIEFLGIPRSNGMKEPIKMKFSISQLLELLNEMSSKKQNVLNISFEIPDDFDINSKDLYNELNKIKIVRYYFNRKMTKDEIEQFKTLTDTRGLSADELKQRSRDFHRLSNLIVEPQKFELSSEQKSKLISNIKWYKKNNSSLLNDDINSIMYYFLQKVVPIPALKEFLIKNQLLYCERFTEDVNENLDKIVGEIIMILDNKNPFNIGDTFDQETFKLLKEEKYINKLKFYKDLIDGEFIAMIPYINYIDSVITHCCDDEYVQIDKKIYPTAKIRNSFAHGRWYITTNNYIVLYDADPRNINDYNLEFVGKINVGSFTRWADSYIIKHKNKINMSKGTNKR